MGGLVHSRQRALRHMLRGYLQLAGHVVLDQLLQKAVVLVKQGVVEADAGTDEDLLDSRHLPKAAEKVHVLLLVRMGLHDGTGIVADALAVRADPGLGLFGAGRMPEVGRGAAHVVDIALEGRVTGQGLRLLDQGAFAPGGDHPPLVEGQGAEAAAAESAPAAL